MGIHGGLMGAHGGLMRFAQWNLLGFNGVMVV
jgi:hypothetical protein